MLLERASGLSAKIAQYDQLKGTAEEAAQFKTRADQFGNVAAKLGAVRAALARFAEASIPVQFTPAEGTALAERARTLRSAVETDPHVLGDPPFNLKHQFTDRLLSLYDGAEQAMLRSWQAYIRSRSDSHSDEVLAALAALPQFRQGIGRIRQARMEIATMAASVPSDLKSATNRLDSLVEAQRTAWAELTADGIPGPVIAFLKACAAEGAPLTGLTDEVRSWLEARKLLGAFRILIR